jgi:hypothetical protein
MGSNAIHCIGRTDKHLSEAFPVYNGQTQGDVLPFLLFNHASVYASKRIKDENKDDYNDVNLLSKNMNIINTYIKTL